jgi:putative Holliday junction resolvase
MQHGDASMANPGSNAAIGNPRPYDGQALPVTALPPAGKLLGLDLGTRTIGVAVSDALRYSATPLETIRRRKFSLDALRIAAILEETGAVGIVLGLPLNMDGSEGRRAQSTRSFARSLQAQVKVPIGLWDERLSTSAVTRMLIEADTRRDRRAEIVDKLAASYILQGALDRLRAFRSG